MAPWGLSQDVLRTELRSELAEIRTELTYKTAEQVLMHEKLLRDELGKLLSDFTHEVLRPELNTLSNHLESVVRESVALVHNNSKQPKSASSRRSMTASQETTNDGACSSEGGARVLVVAAATTDSMALDEDGFVMSSQDVTTFSGFPGHQYSKLLGEEDEEVDQQRETQTKKRQTLRFDMKKLVQAASSKKEEVEFTWEAFLQGNRFHTIVSALVILNLISLGLETDNEARNFDQPKPKVFRFSELCFLIIFVLELLLRFAVYRWDILSQMDANLTILDFAAVALQLINTYDPGIFGNYDINFLCFRAFRLSRALNAMHVTQNNSMGNLISELRMILSTLVGSLRSLLWVGGFLLLTTYCFSNYIMKILSHHWKLHPEAARGKEVEDIRSMYGSMSASMLTLYQVLTDGIEWRYACQPLMDHLPEDSMGIAVGFVIYVAFALFVLLNVITGLFLSAAQESAEEDKKRLYRDEMLRVFEDADVDGSGDITYFELESQLGTKRFQHCLQMLGLHEDNVLALFEILDEDKSGAINSDAFVDGCVKLTGTTKAIDFAVFRTRHEEHVRDTMQEICRCKDLLYQVIHFLAVPDH
eukprot:TRINITY_DN74995_c0_g1_i1.p1 TRINITY_DN74995_c0_g1~~TRINITY_DN74995_c0_g1_i1.p1  ORF type:complete len:590 (+),score=106.27 TRINITY_DN74995_c0_g1_i1:53-1822(+)